MTPQEPAHVSTPLASTTAYAVVDGISIRIAPDKGPRQSYLLDMTPSTASFLDAPLAAGKSFVDSLDGVTITTTSVSATMATVQVTFTKYQLSVAKSGTGGGTLASSPTGINCGATCSAPFDAESTVTLTASPATGSRFAGWSDDCWGTSSTCVLAMDAVRSVTADFEPLIRVTVSGELSGYYATSGIYDLYHRGRGVSDTGKVTPKTAGDRLDFTWQKKQSGSWVTKGTKGLVLGSTSSVSFKLSTSGLAQASYRIRCIFRGDSSHASGTSSWSYFKVTS